MIEKNSFKGLFPILFEFNSGLYSLFQAAPSYVGKFFIGLFYGLILGFVFSCWRDELLRNILLFSTGLWILSVFDCVIIRWDKIYYILGYSGRLNYTEISCFFYQYCLEIGIALLVAILVYTTVIKYRGSQGR